mmetsp:Transcript_17005/g.45299  ORF Transcript_17005/g.45299 Transcript_17005/m.45299 type:complete len:216 (+) Transcript_17005:605-1252(+)
MDVRAARDLFCEFGRTRAAGRRGRRLQLRRRRARRGAPREYSHDDTGARRGLARLPPHVPLGLRGRRARLAGPVEPHEGVHRPLLDAWPRDGPPPILEPHAADAAREAAAGGRPAAGGRVRGQGVPLPALPCAGSRRGPGQAGAEAGSKWIAPEGSFVIVAVSGRVALLFTAWVTLTGLAQLALLIDKGSRSVGVGVAGSASVPVRTLARPGSCC